jgi:hypothetical protein
MAPEQEETRTQNTQYDNIGTKYNAIKVLPSVEPEEPSIINALGSVQGKRCLGTFQFHVLSTHLQKLKGITP